MMNDAEIVYAISTGDTPEINKMDLLEKHIVSIKRGERIRLANLLMNDTFQEKNDE